MSATSYRNRRWSSASTLNSDGQVNKLPSWRHYPLWCFYSTELKWRMPPRPPTSLAMVVHVILTCDGECPLCVMTPLYACEHWRTDVQINRKPSANSRSRHFMCFAWSFLIDLYGIPPTQHNTTKVTNKHAEICKLVACCHSADDFSTIPSNSNQPGDGRTNVSDPLCRRDAVLWKPSAWTNSNVDWRACMLQSTTDQKCCCLHLPRTASGGRGCW